MSATVGQTAGAPHERSAAVDSGATGPHRVPRAGGDVESRFAIAADLLEGYVHESRFVGDGTSAEHRIVWASEGFETIFGCTVEEYNRGAPWGGRYHPDECEAAVQRAAALRRGETVEAELRLLHPRRGLRWLYVKNRPVIDPVTGKVTGVIGIGQDFTRDKADAQQRGVPGEPLGAPGAPDGYATILETLHEAVLVFDSVGAIRYANTAAERMLGVAPLTGRALSNFGLWEAFRGQATIRASGSRPAQTYANGMRADGARFFAKLTFDRMALNDKTLTVAVLRDATEQALLEREIIDIASREQQRIALGLHDGLGQELTGAALLLRSLAERIPSDQPAIAGLVEEIIGVLNRGIDHARTLARGLSPVELERGGLTVALSSLADRSRRPGAADVRFQARDVAAEPVAPQVADHLYRIAEEAVGNALRHSGATAVRIELHGRDGALEMSISDDGCGAAGRAAAGGMGLRIMRYRARMIGARLDVASRSGSGTCVSCVLPLNDAFLR